MSFTDQPDPFHTINEAGVKANQELAIEEIARHARQMARLRSIHMMGGAPATSEQFSMLRSG